MKKVCFCDLKSWHLKLLLLMFLLRLWSFSKVYWEVWGEISQAVHRLWGLRWRLTAGLPPKTCKWGELTAKYVIDRDPPTHEYDNVHEKNARMSHCLTLFEVIEIQASIIPCWWRLYLWPRSQPRLWPNTDIAIGHKDCAMVKIGIKSSSTDAHTEPAKKSVILNQYLLLLWLWLGEGRPGRFWVGLMELLLWWWGVFLWRPWSTSPVKITAALIWSWLFQSVLVIWGRD